MSTYSKTQVARNMSQQRRDMCDLLQNMALLVWGEDELPVY